MKKVLLVLLVIAGTLNVNLNGQNIELSFSGDNNGEDVTLDSLYIKNLTQGADIMLYAPDSTINLLIVGNNELLASSNSHFNLSQNFPNPFRDKTELNFYLDKSGILEVEVFNLRGQRVAQFQRPMIKGNHHFSFIPGGEKVYLLSATAFGITKSVKMFCTSDSNKDCSINYIGNTSSNNYFKSEELSKDFPFELGDELLLIGYSELGESGMVVSPEEPSNYTIQFATNIPCLGVPTVEYEGQVYNTIQIYSQCWLKENLNIGEMIYASQSQENNNTIEKYCPLNSEYYCNTFSGGLYQWNEMMNYVNESGAQGICPNGWHIPSDYEWRILEGATDSEYAIGDSEWGSSGWRGSDAGGNLKQTGTEWWESPNTGATDAFGFAALPGGYVVQDEYWGGGWKAYFWSSHVGHRYFRNMDHNEVKVRRGNGNSGGFAASVRCVKDLD